MRFIKQIFLLFLLMPLSLHAVSATKAPPAKKVIEIVTTLNVLKSIAQEIGGDLVHAESLLKADEDPHSIRALPTYKLKVKNARLMFWIDRGLEFKVHQVVSSSANADLIEHGGLVTVSTGYKTLEVPKPSHAQGDIHPQGNPHIWLAPTGGLKIAENIRDALIKIDPANKNIYEKNFNNFKTKLCEALFGKEILALATPNHLWTKFEGKTLTKYLSDKKKTPGGLIKLAAGINQFISFHTIWSYLVADFNLKQVFGDIEEKPGIGTSPAYIDALVKRALEDHIKNVIAATYYKGYSSLIQEVANKIHGQAIFIAADALPNESYVDMLTRIINSMAALKAPPTPPKASGAPTK